MTPYAAPWTPEQGEHYRLEMHRHAEEKAELVEALKRVVRELEGDMDWTQDRWLDAVQKALGHSTEALKRLGRRW